MCVRAVAASSCWCQSWGHFSGSHITEAVQQLQLTSALSTSPTSPLQCSELTASKNSKPTVVAGAIAARAREGGCPSISSIGPEAVCTALVATAHARLYLEVRRNC